jgi:mRNA-degrading endonuclease RelE of RelBE toxin-antitoxin system
MKRTIYKSKAFEEFYLSLNERTRKKILYLLQIIEDEDIISSKFVKKLINSDFYELRISTDNEYRIINFTMDDDSFINSRKILLLNGFVKKSESDYIQQITTAQHIMAKEGFIDEND